MQAGKPQPRALTIWRIYLSLGMFVPAFLGALLLREPGALRVWLGIGWLVAYLAAYAVYLPLCYERFNFRLEGDELKLESGVFYCRERTIPLGNIQYVTLRTGPAERVFGLRTLVIVLAGGRATIPGLLPRQGEQLARALSREAGESEAGA